MDKKLKQLEKKLIKAIKKSDLKELELTVYLMKFSNKVKYINYDIQIK